MSSIIFPRPLRKGDRIAIISPASAVKPEYVDGAARAIAARGFVPVVMPHAKGPADGSFAAGERSRIADFTAAWNDTGTKAVLCARGGYGCVGILPAVPGSMLRANAKWLVGFSDVSALHAMLRSAGIASVHGPMAKHLTEEPADDPSTEALFRMLTSEDDTEHSLPTGPLSFCGEAEGRIAGGNLAVLNGLASTRFDMLKCGPADDDVILFLEDIAEPIYKVERVLWRLRLNGTLNRVAGLVFGAFTDYRPDRNFPSMEEMIRSRILDCGLEGKPEAFRFPEGHQRENLPILEGSWARLSITPETTTLKMSRR